MDNLFLEEFSDPIDPSTVKEIQINEQNNMFKINNDNELNFIEDYDISTDTIIHKKENLSEEVNNNKIYDISNLFNREIIYKNIIMSNIEHTDHNKSSNKLVYNLNDKYSGIHTFKNVVGFRLSEFIMNLPPVNIVDNITLNEFSLTIEKGLYTINTFIAALNTKFNENGSGTFSFDSQKMQVSWNHVKDFPLNSSILSYDGGGTKKLLDILGYDNHLDLNSQSLPSPNPPNLLLGSYIDIVVDEIPSEACKSTCIGRNIIARIPIKVDGDSDIIYYDNRRFNCNYESNNLFYPINIDKLSISLFIDNSPLSYSNIDYSFDFELTILNR